MTRMFFVDKLRIMIPGKIIAKNNYKILNYGVGNYGIDQSILKYSKTNLDKKCKIYNLKASCQKLYGNLHGFKENHIKSKIHY